MAMAATATTKRKIHLNFITLHYIYIVGLIILGSILIYPVKNIRYVDALFFACGAATQSGLNTVDVNLIKLYQQILLYLIPMIANPIFINTVVVIVRLHWFEKRFERVVLQSRPSRSRTMSQGNPRERSLSQVEQGIRGREITVLRDSGIKTGKFDVVEGPGGMMMQPSQSQSTLMGAGGGASSSTTTDNGKDDKEVESAGTSSSTTTAEYHMPGSPTSPNIQFAALPVPPSRDSADENPHIAFVESQRSPHSGKTLRIPGPREFEMGDRAVEVDDEENNTLAPSRTQDGDRIREIPSRTMSMTGALTNASTNAGIRMRKPVPTLEGFLPAATTAISSAFSVGNAKTHQPFRPFSRSNTQEIKDMPYLSYNPTVVRNSNFVDLTDEQRDELGGIEYRSLKLLLKVLIWYYIFFHAFGIVSLLPWIYNSLSYREYVESIGVSPGWWAAFTSATCFNDLGFTLTPDSMIHFQKASWVLVSMTFLIIIGNTGFPCMLRFIIWILFKLTPKESSMKECLNFLLDHPRRCFTLLFPSRETWVLFWVLVILNIADVILFIVLDLNDKDVTDIAVGHRILSAIFQAASTRTSGTAVVNLATLHPAVQVSYMIMMYISIFPIAISVRRTNVYEESALGIYHGEEEEEEFTNSSYVGVHLRKQLSFDLWYIFLGLFIICIAEGGHIEDKDDYAFTVFAILFEVVSAYGTVGLSLGHPTINASFAAKFTTFSKLVICAMQIRGRHRGLPYEVDRAILLPKDKRDVENSSLRRRGSSLSTVRPQLTRTFSQAPSQAVDV